MTKWMKYVIILLTIVVLSLSGCNPSTRTNTLEKDTASELSKKEIESNMEKETNMFIRALGIDKDCAQGAVECARDSGVGEITHVKRMNSEAGYAALVTDINDISYTFGFGSMGYLEYIRSEKNGEYLYAAYD